MIKTRREEGPETTLGRRIIKFFAREGGFAILALTKYLKYANITYCSFDNLIGSKRPYLKLRGRLEPIKITLLAKEIVNGQ